MMECKGDRCYLSGNLTHDQVASLLDDCTAFLDQRSVVIDLAGVQAVDSSALSLMLEWTRRAAARKVAISFANLGPSLSSLIDLYGVSDIIPVTTR
jgi:phospholipid transport system transporter-binding protein